MLSLIVFFGLSLASAGVMIMVNHNHNSDSWFLLGLILSIIGSAVLRWIYMMLKDCEYESVTKHVTGLYCIPLIAYALGIILLSIFLFPHGEGEEVFRAMGILISVGGLLWLNMTVGYLDEKSQEEGFI